MALGTSKGFRAHFSSLLLDHQVDALRLWASNNCATSTVFRDDFGAVVLMAMRDRPRTAASHARSLRCALRRMPSGRPEGMAVDLCLRGKWLHLVSSREVLALCEANGPRQGDGPMTRAPPLDDDIDGVRLIRLR